MEPKQLKVFIGSDHAGFDTKKLLIDYISSLKAYDIVDKGCSVEQSKQSVDYPDFSKLVCDEVIKDPESLGLLVCGTGIGIGIAANKIAVTTLKSK